jgi:hypothetical protein
MYRLGWRTYCVFVGLCFVPTTIVWACRYTVRDLGFVELRGPEYSLNLAVATEADPEEYVLRTEGEDWLRRLAAELSNSNVRWGFMEPPPVAESAPPELAGQSAATDELPSARRFTATLVDRQGRRLRLRASGRIDDSKRSDSDRPVAPIDSWVRLIFSPTRDVLSREEFETFASIVVVEGSDQASNQQAWKIANQAALAIRKVEPMLPRPIAVPVRTLRVELDQRLADPVLIWGLGLEPQAEPTKAILAVVYGRGRLAGPVMVGDAIELRETLVQLSLVGESCECETDRGWLDERVLPHRSVRGERERASQALGFDPESPLVRAEMIRIVSQGPKSPSRPLTAAPTGSDNATVATANAIERWLLGYSEADLRAYADADSDSGLLGPPPTDLSVPNIVAKPLSKVRSQVIQGEGWEFDEDAAATVVTGQTDSSQPKPVAVSLGPHPAGLDLSEQETLRVARDQAAAQPSGGMVSEARNPRTSPLVMSAVASLAILLGLSLLVARLAWHRNAM